MKMWTDRHTDVRHINLPKNLKYEEKNFCCTSLNKMPRYLYFEDVTLKENLKPLYYDSKESFKKLY